MSTQRRTQAIALSSADAGRAPRVVAKGYGVAAEAIVQRARDSGVYVHDCAPLLDILMRVDLDQEIPPALYLVVAELLAWMHQLEQPIEPTHPLK